MITFADFDALAVEVAELLTGRAVAIRWRSPASIGAIGTTSKFFDKFVIEIDPNLSMDQALKTYLHECAHVLLHGDQMCNSAVAVRPPASIVDNTAIDQGHNARELEADQLAEYWLSEAEEEAYVKTEYRMLQALKRLYTKQ